MEVDRLARTTSATVDNVRSANTRRSSGGKWIALGIARCIPLIFHTTAGTRCPEVVQSPSCICERSAGGAPSLIIIR